MTPLHMLPGLLQRVAAIPELEATREDAAQLLLATAFNFPAVLATAGKQQWPQLQPVHSALLQCRDAAVRRTLACSLHEVAALLGPDQAMTDLGPAIQVGSPCLCSLCCVMNACVGLEQRRGLNRQRQIWPL